MKFLEMLGANFKRQFDAETYEKFFAGMGYEKTGYEIVCGRMSCDVAVIEVRKNQGKIVEKIIKAERMILRPVQESDLEAVHEYAGDKEITMMMFLPNETKEETEKFIGDSIADWKNENPHDREFVIVYEGKVIGGIDLENCGDGTFEIGWIVNKKYRGLGIASEAASALVDYGFKELGAKKIIAHCDSKNKASEKVMVKIGMKLKDDKETRVYPKTGVVSGEYLYELENNREKHGEN